MSEQTDWLDLLETHRPDYLSEARDAARKRCSVDGCDRPYEGLGFCRLHYRRWNARGSTDPYRGQRLNWLRKNAIYAGDDCLRWPFKSKTGTGYPAFGLTGHESMAHREMCKLAHGAPDGKMHAAHSCGNRWCLNPKHLRWATPKENEADKIAHGTSPVGENNGAAKINADIVRGIRQNSEQLSQSALARRYGLSQSAVSMIARGKRWGHVA